ncbi:MAG: hypothetical protein CVU61_05565 [Deltaproteobacteria bacterium HGW-Deltaproteobacteria-19]|jgi:hypothetical protein|nr:MAG: hypothetical protein CVU61_05565 [Deltaproteobacteria bacterium HGW-Deltaproteobacteria-19]
MTESVETWWVVLFDSVHHAMQAEKLLIEEGIPHKLVPVPRHISSDCGVCLRFAAADRTRVADVLDRRGTYREIRPL